MYAWDMAPGLGRGFALDGLLIADKKTEACVREEFRDKIDFNRVVRIAGSDSDARAIAIAKSNIGRIVSGRGGKGPEANIIELKTLSVESACPPWTLSPDTPGFIITNPPYGRRLGDQAQSEQIYSGMKVMERPFSGWKLGVITDHEGFESFFGKKSDSCRPISNGAVPSYFFQYDVL
jgi:putative N6-adenine-specific DNA methylase